MQDIVRYTGLASDRFKSFLAPPLSTNVKSAGTKA
jgi:hypothetical protein